MKKILFIALSAALLFTACGKEEVISVKEKTLRMNIDEKYTLKLTEGNQEEVLWESNDESIALVSPDGTVTATGNGITTVTAKGEKSYVHVGVIVGGNNDYTDQY